ncbi:hypothetical protein M422DRAFT_173464 [Sphaerobolus stellatus SS14]|uniref:Uncharacterized protein n=1 Tax=Sphaerobolus stellatus (strain SS14) TaxID=990650 RepID=A0A0C9V0M4_SPHS4|nr:hypothetical protein M422DRAFT_173464 [Sphaerobolus stellatus SS14]
MVLGGIIYYGQNHFTSRIIDEDGSVFCSDGIINKRMCIYEGQLNNISAENLWTHRFRRASAVIYYSSCERNHLAVRSSGPLG